MSIENDLQRFDGPSNSTDVYYDQLNTLSFADYPQFEEEKVEIWPSVSDPSNLVIPHLFTNHQNAQAPPDLAVIDDYKANQQLPRNRWGGFDSNDAMGLSSMNHRASITLGQFYASNVYANKIDRRQNEPICVPEACFPTQTRTALKNETNATDDTLCYENSATQIQNDRSFMPLDSFYVLSPQNMNQAIVPYDNAELQLQQPQLYMDVTQQPDPTANMESFEIQQIPQYPPERITKKRATRPRIHQACGFCQRRKKKCDLRLPQCGACKKANVPCVSPDRDNSTDSASSRVDLLNQRLHWLEKSLTDLSGLKIRSIHTGENLKQILKDALKIDKDTIAKRTRVSKQMKTKKAICDNKSQISNIDDYVVDSFYLIKQQDFVENKNVAKHFALSGPASGCLIDIDPYSPNFLGRVRRMRTLHSVKVEPYLPLCDLQSSKTLLNLFFKHPWRIWPFVNESLLMTKLEIMHKSPEFDKCISVEFYFVYNVLMAISRCLVRSQDEAFLANYHKPENYIQEALRYLSFASETEDMASLISLTGLCLYSFMRPTYHGLNLLALKQAAVQSAKKLKFNRLHQTVNDSYNQTEIVYLQSQKWLFWSIYTIECTISLSTDATATLVEDETITTVPENYDDWGNPATDEQIRSIKPILQYLKFLKISAMIKSKIHCRSKHFTQSEFEEVITDLRSKLDEWHQETVSVFSNPEMHPYFQEKVWLTQYYKAIILLYRPCNSMRNIPEWMILVAGQTAEKLICHLNRALQARNLEYIWPVLDTLYQSSLTYIWAVKNVSKYWRVTRERFQEMIELAVWTAKHFEVIWPEKVHEIMNIVTIYGDRVKTEKFTE